MILSAAILWLAVAAAVVSAFLMEPPPAAPNAAYPQWKCAQVDDEWAWEAPYVETADGVLCFPIDVTASLDKVPLKTERPRKPIAAMP
jgi:hypothetical protein